MRVYAIKDSYDAEQRGIAYLVYYEKSKKFYIELPDDADEWNTPLLLSSRLKKGEHSINSYWSKLWVQQRIVPPDRQNIGAVLRDNGLNEYDEYRLLMLSHGRCEQDGYYLEPIAWGDFEDRFRSRFEYKLDCVVPVAGNRVLCFLRNGYVCRFDVGKRRHNDVSFAPVLANRKIFERVKLQTDGYGISFGDGLDISDEEIYYHGDRVDMSFEDFKAFVQFNLVTTAEAMELLDCTRQNIDDLTRRGTLKPIKVSAKSKLYLKNEVSDRLK